MDQTFFTVVLLHRKGGTETEDIFHTKKAKRPEKKFIRNI